MMLGINTAGVCELALVEKGEVLFEECRLAQSRESEYLLPKIVEVLHELKRDFWEIRQILVVNGPGSYTALRVGISIANALAYSLKCVLFEISAFELFWLKDKGEKYEYAVFPAGRSELFVQKRGSEKVEIVEREEFWKNFGSNFFVIGGAGALSNEGKIAEISISTGEIMKISVEKPDLLSFGEALCRLDFEKLHACEMAMPNYLREANVTKSSKPLSLC